MSEETGATGPYTLWINWTDRIVSFTAVQGSGFEPMVFPSNEEKMDYVFSYCSSGFRIQ